jgi:hypothetical protein
VAYTLSRNLKLRLDSNLTANARHNLERLDLLGATFLVDTLNNLNLRSQTDILIEPESADVGGSGIGGSVNFGTSSHALTGVTMYTSDFNVRAPLGTLDQASSGTKYLNIQYKSDLNGSVDTSADRALSLDVEGADRQVILGGNYSQLGGNLALTLSGATALTLPLVGTVATLAGTETLTNKSIDADNNTITNIENADIKVNAAIAYSKLNLTGSIVNADLSPSASVSYSKLSLTDSIVNADVNSAAAIAYSKLNLASSIVNADISNSAAIVYSKLDLDGSIVNADIGSGADIAYSKLDLTASITNQDIAGSAEIVYQKLDLGNSIVNTDIHTAAAIAYSKLSLSDSLLNADINSSAAIAGTKISPDFGTQNIETEGQVRFNNSGGDYNSFETSESQSETIGYVLPTSAPIANQLLRASAAEPTELEWATISGSGTVTEVALELPDIFDLTGSPITTAGTFEATLADQAANEVFAGPTNGAAAEPAFRSLVAADIPSALPATKIADGSVSDAEFQFLNGVSSGIQGQIDGKQATDADLTAIAALASTGIAVRTAANTWAQRTLTASTGISISDGDGVSGNPTISTTITQYTDELAQDAIGPILTDSASIDFTYNDGGPSITAAVLPAGVDHDSLLNFVANEHIDHTAVDIATASTSGLDGGGTIAATRNLVISPSRATAADPALDDTIIFGDTSDSDGLKKTSVEDLLILAGYAVASDWTSGTSKIINHNFNDDDITAHVYDTTTGEDVYPDSVVRTDENTMTLTASPAPTSWRVLVKKNFISELEEHELMANVLEYFSMSATSGAETGVVAGTVMSAVNNPSSAANGPGGETVRTFVRASSQYFTTTVADNSLLDLDDRTRCFSVWVKPATDNIAMGILSRYVTATSTRQFLYYRASGNKANTTINTPALTATAQGSTEASILSGSWYLLWFWHDADNNQIGNAVNDGAGSSRSHTTGSLTTATDPFRIGWQTSANHWGGDIGPITYYDIVPTQAQRTDIYNAGAFRPFPYLAS